MDLLRGREEMGLSSYARGAGRETEEEEQREEHPMEQVEIGQSGAIDGAGQDANENHVGASKTTIAPLANNRKRPHWTSPKTEEFDSLTAFSDPQIVVERLAERARQHWDKRDSVKEG